MLLANVQNAASETVENITSGGGMMQQEGYEQGNGQATGGGGADEMGYNGYGGMNNPISIDIMDGHAGRAPMGNRVVRGFTGGLNSVFGARGEGNNSRARGVGGVNRNNGVFMGWDSLSI